MKRHVLPFERPAVELADRLSELAPIAARDEDIAAVIPRLEEVQEKLEDRLNADLGRWQRVQLSRHPQRPYTLDYADLAFEGFLELHGDRHFADDAAIVGGLARLRGRNVMLIGTQKGRNTHENMRRNFGMPRPEGYRKALRIMRVAERFQLPIVCLIDTPGAYPGLDAEERGQAEAIAYNLEAMMGLKVPVVCIVTGEGGSGGALAIGVGNKVFMLSNSVYSVISPEAASAILFREQGRGQDAAEALRLTASDLKDLGVVDDIIEEPRGGAHRDHQQAADALGDRIVAALDELSDLKPDELVDQRIRRFRALGVTESS
ncbi:MAG TPA: acetyl-CoA carboxylase carboxyl transferase subunit alpha [Myxococcales bacterium]|jgi:acetyl-CoA carboxylase carboxyl transferase subunit alpha|nr:acetyl-CoA carboxylase carboxyl transferase subunit alpha [Myxococcales bacterium]MBF94729.1 acetyl-CoA carboxylase carboxyl transferase subunit alpha [Myxococcales bacterium]HBU49134.1 acetyl-CoA carboxylase carboxyl transferase subunit alpha [Myxococcales bacterium]